MKDSKWKLENIKKKSDIVGNFLKDFVEANVGEYSVSYAIESIEKLIAEVEANKPQYDMWIEKCLYY